VATYILLTLAIVMALATSLWSLQRARRAARVARWRTQGAQLVPVTRRDLDQLTSD
jgi:hypothetical protein